MKRLVLSVLMLVMCTIVTAWADSTPIELLPMYGGKEKTQAMKDADAFFIHWIEKKGMTRQQGAEKSIDLGWAHFSRGELDTAMKRFNQAWLLDPENGNSYRGFAIITLERGGKPAEVEKLFQLALSKSRVQPEVFVDYGRFLWEQKQYDQSLSYLNTALQRSPEVLEARANISFVYYLKGDFGKACQWAKAAKQKGDDLEHGYLEKMCSQASR